MFPLIVADIGGTNARFGLVQECTQAIHITEQHVFDCSQYDTFSHVLHAYLSLVPNFQPKNICIAIAGPIIGDSVKMTNLQWTFSIKQIKQQFELERFEVINDFAAQALAVTQLHATDLITIQPGELLATAPKTILGPGTGLGVASLVHTRQGWIALPGEGGHANFAPSSLLEIEIFKILRNAEQYVSLETLLCGNGLIRLHTALSEINGTISKNTETLLPADITKEALHDKKSISYKTLCVFCRVLGGAAGNIALTVGARGGVYLTGGILPRVSNILLESDFKESFNSKGVMQPYVEKIPAYLITHPQPALLGAAAHMNNL